MMLKSALTKPTNITLDSHWEDKYKCVYWISILDMILFLQEIKHWDNHNKTPMKKWKINLSTDRQETLPGRGISSIVAPPRLSRTRWSRVFSACVQPHPGGGQNGGWCAGAKPHSGKWGMQPRQTAGVPSSLPPPINSKISKLQSVESLG